MRGTGVEAEFSGSEGTGPEREVRARPEAAARKRAAVELIRSHGPVLRTTARRYSICADDADDAYQRGLEILLEKAPTTDPRQLVPWSRTVIKHEALAVRKARERILGRPAGVAVIEEEQDWVQMIPSDRDGPEEQMAGREKVARSREALARLKPNELRALTQLAEGYSYAEIGAMNDWTRTKVNRCLAEGRQRFRSAFRESESGERCARVESLLSACCDGELDRARLAEVEDHLAACGSCRATLRTYRAVPKAAAALAPLLPVSRGLWERVQETVVMVQNKLAAIGADPAGAGAGTAGAARGALPAAAVKIAAACAGTAGTAAICVATGVLPAPVLNHHPERNADRPVEQVEAGERPQLPVYDPLHAGAETAPAARPAPAPKTPSRPNRDRAGAPAPPPPAPAPTPTETEFTPEAAGAPVQAAAPPPPVAAASSGGGGSGGSVPVGGGGEFGP